MSFSPDFNLSDQAAYNLAVHYGAGMKSGNVCGAVTGALMALGLAGKSDEKFAHQVLQKFKENHKGCLNCVDLLRQNKEAGGNTLSDGVSGEHIPHDLSLLASPGKVAHSADDSAEGLGVVSRMERDEAHLAHINAALDLGHECVVYLSVSHMSPPDEDVGVVKHLVRQTLIGVVERGKSYFDVIVL